MVAWWARLDRSIDVGIPSTEMYSFAVIINYLKFGGSMEIFSFFDIYDYAILVGLILIAIFFLIYFHVKIKREISKKESLNLLKTKKINILIGLLIIIISIVLLIYLEWDINKQLTILQPISIMTSEPIVFLSIALFLLGFAFTVIGIHRNIQLKRLVKPAKVV